ncbi:phosphotransferase family protein [Streptomyces tsukubensis]|uniref:Aminoglycoside phosphotransferase domain-containing protein n=1 Tax=Streptomyces tsukubensis TaxID=83656 RepID=A0A1V4A5L5_9ACTN|nr:phosphotransferase [Streptomyces tsukubensis]OON76011.1 hypothetical protein B1H18_22075 [Streptomyces tsukubensis]QFR94102.1 phosphotransferase [Streptomyces tsukubensis]
MIERVEWDRLPGGVREAVQERVGRVAASEVHQQGLNCSVALTLHAAAGRTFMKGVRAEDTDGAEALAREELVNPFVCAVGPAAWHAVHTDGWSLLLFDHVDGRNADLAPGSADLGPVADALRRMSRIAGASLQGVERLVDRLGQFLTDEEAARLDGDHLLHTDTNPHNLMIDGAGRAHVVDWAMPALGPVWVDAACTAVRLMEDGHSPKTALAWLNAIESWQRAAPAAVAAFVAGTCRHWTARVGEKGALPSNTRFQYLLVGVPHPATCTPPH